MKSQILIGASDFMQSLSRVSRIAKKSLYIQAMTFEGDSAGEELIDLMIASPAQDKRLIIDSFSKVVVSDHFVFGSKYLTDRSFRAEVQNTKTLLQKAEQHNIKVRFVNPTGFLMWKYPLRNHKKMMILDTETSYLGGINFSDHNFAWHDMMIEMEDAEIGRALSDDFLATWEGANQSSRVELGKDSLYFFNGTNSSSQYENFFDLIRNAKEQITVISPYVSDPLIPVLAEAAAKGVKIEIISPEQNNKGLFQDYLLNESSSGFFQLRHYPGMFHLKAMLIDDSRLIFGSSNYDLISYHFEQEVVMVSEDIELVNEFKTKVSKPMRSKSKDFLGGGVSSRRAQVTMAMLRQFCKYASKTLLRPKS